VQSVLASAANSLSTYGLLGGIIDLFIIYWSFMNDDQFWIIDGRAGAYSLHAGPINLEMLIRIDRCWLFKIWEREKHTHTID